MCSTPCSRFGCHVSFVLCIRKRMTHGLFSRFHESLGEVLRRGLVAPAGLLARSSLPPVVVGRRVSFQARGSFETSMSRVRPVASRSISCRGGCRAANTTRRDGHQPEDSKTGGHEGQLNGAPTVRVPSIPLTCQPRRDLWRVRDSGSRRRPWYAVRAGSEVLTWYRDVGVLVRARRTEDEVEIFSYSPH